MFKGVFFLVSFFGWMSVFAQPNDPLPRKAFFGAAFQPSNGHLIIDYIAETGTAAQLNLKVGDRLDALNGTAITQVDDLYAVIDRSAAGDRVEVTVLRDGQSRTESGSFVGRPLETSTLSDVVYDAAPYKDGLLRVIINKPRIEGKHPAMLFIPGYTCSSIDNLTDDHPYKRIVDAFAAEGYVTLRIEKSGLGDSRNTPKCESCDLLDEVENFEAGLRKLKSLPYVDTTRIIVFGHSMGGIIAPALSAKNNVAGVVVYGTTAKSWFEYQIEMHRVQTALTGVSPLEVEEYVRSQYELNYRFFVKNEPLSEIAKGKQEDELLRTAWGWDGDGMIFSRNAEYWRQIQSYPHLQNWASTSADVLVLFGESDFQAFSLADHQQIVDAVNFPDGNRARLVTFAETDHYFAKVGNMQDAFNLFATAQYQALFNAYNFAVGTTAVEWSNEVLGR